MAKQRIISRPGWFGSTNYFDENGRYIGQSRPGAFGTKAFFDADGRFVGESREGFLAKEVFRSADHKRYITTYDGFFGECHYENGKSVGHTSPGWFGTEYSTIETEDPVEMPEEDCYEEIYERESLGQEAPETPKKLPRSPKPSQYEIVRNLQLFVLSLVIVALIACIYAVIKCN